MFPSLFSCCTSAANRPYKPTTLPTLDSASTVAQSPLIDQFMLALMGSLSEQDQARQLNMQLVQAIDHGDATGMQQALEEGANANAPIQEQHLHAEFNTPLQLAAWKGSAGAIQILLANGATASINQPNRLGVTPLHFAVESGRVEAVEALLAGGGQASINQPDAEGHTPLETALINNVNREIVWMLVTSGANPALLSVSLRQQHAPELKAVLKALLVKLGQSIRIEHRQNPDFATGQAQVRRVFGAVHRFSEAGISLNARNLKRIQKMYNQTLMKTNQLVAQDGSRIEKLKLIGKMLPILRSGVPLNQEQLNKLAENAKNAGYLEGLVAATEAGASRVYLGLYVVGASKSPFVVMQ